MTALDDAVDGLAARIDTIQGLQVVKTVQAFNFPTCLIGLPDVLDFDDLDEGDYTAIVPLWVLVAAAPEDGWMQALPFIDPRSTRSIYQAVNGDRTLGGLNVDARVTGFPRLMTMDEVAAYRAYGKFGQARIIIGD